MSDEKYEVKEENKVRTLMDKEGLSFAYGQGSHEAPNNFFSTIKFYSGKDLKSTNKKSLGSWYGNNLNLGGEGGSGSLGVIRSATLQGRKQFRTIILDGRSGNIAAGGFGTDGDLKLFQPHDRLGSADHNGYSSIRLSAGNKKDRNPHALMKIGGNGVSGQIRIFPANKSNNNGRDANIRIDGKVGDISLRNADLAEEFDIREQNPVTPGTVMVIADQTGLVVCGRAYDRKVAGIISGAGPYKPALILDQQEGATNRQAVALAGKVYCKVDARLGAIKTGDLLTTSTTPGHAMLASDPIKSIGAIVGKALADLDDGCDMIPVLSMMS